MKRKKINSFTPHWGYKATFLGLGIMAAAMHVLMFRFIPDMSVIPLPMILLLLGSDALLLWYSIIFSTQSRVTVYEEGIEIEQGNSKVFTTWDNISHFGLRWAGRNQQRGLVLYEDVQPQAGGIEKLFYGWKTKFLSLTPFVNLPRKGIFSMEVDTEKLLETEFGKTIYEFAPHLFDSEKAKNRLKDGYNNDNAMLANEESYDEAQENQQF